jgi:CxxC motif-containing protein
MKKKELICVICPNGCPLAVLVEEGTEGGPAFRVLAVEGEGCEKGPEWAEQEITHPVRTIASSILVEGGDFPLVSVRTDAPIPLGRIFEVMKEIRSVRVTAPVKIGDILVKNPAGTSCNLVATRMIRESNAS